MEITIDIRMLASGEKQVERPAMLDRINVCDDEVLVGNAQMRADDIKECASMFATFMLGLEQCGWQLGRVRLEVDENPQPALKATITAR